MLIDELNETYHSTHGARTESEYVFIKMGLENFMDRACSIFEMGFGSGLNAILTYIYGRDNNIDIHYSSLEKYPLKDEEYDALDYFSLFDQQVERSVFDSIVKSPYQKATCISDHFTLKKIEDDLIYMSLENETYDLIYYDAFGPRVQPDLWTKEITDKLYRALRINGILVTYCAQGQFRRNLQASGFEVERLQGPPGKREMIRAQKH